jgi:outer membrane murein-binding lipoprotein Lpp
MKSRLTTGALAAVLLGASIALSGCSFENKYEKEADRITKAVMANDLAPVKDDISPQLHITRVQIAAASDELNEQGKLESVKEVTPCPEPAGTHCLLVKFQKSTYHETLAMDDQNKVTKWTFHMADAAR